MESVDFNKIENFMDYLNQNGGRSHDRIIELKDNGELYYMMDIYGIETSFINLFVDFINKLEDPTLDNYPHYRKLNLNINKYMQCFTNYGFEFSAYLDNMDSYRNFPLFFQSCARKFGFFKYANVPIKELDLYLSNTVDLIHQHNLNKNTYEVLTHIKYPLNKNKYKEYDDRRSNNIKINYNDVDDFFIYAEEKMLNHINNNPYGYNDIAIWVSRYYGDGYGYDILTYDPLSKKEVIIEVKSGLGKNFIITKNEYKTMVNATKSGLTDYLIYKCYYDNSKLKETNTTFRYDIVENKLVDINNRHNIYSLTPNQYFENGNMIMEFYATKDQEEILTRQLSK